MIPLLEVQHLQKIYRDSAQENTAGAYDINFAVAPSQCTGLVGFSGCGKSTLAALLMGLLPADAGRILLDGLPVDFADSTNARRYYQNVQLIQQNASASLHPLYSIGHTLRDALRHRGAERSQYDALTAQLLEQVGLPQNSVQKRPHQLSGGEAQRAAVARALALKPRLLICDEITSALDVIVQQQIVQLLQKLQCEENLALLFISHDLAAVQQLCSDLLIMDAGRIVERGSFAQIATHPRHNATQKLLTAAQKISLP